MSILKAAILDDEKPGATLLARKLENFNSEIRLEAIYNNPLEAIKEISALSIDVLFLDVEMPVLNGFQFLQELGEFNFEIIFTTAYDSYILEALRMSAVDYLLKPIDEEDLAAAISRLNKRILEKQKALKSKPANPGASKRLALPTSEGIYLIDKTSIINVEAMSNYSTFHLNPDKKVMVSKTLKEYETMLNEAPFLRVSRSNIINLDFVVKYRKGEGGILEMSDGREIEVSQGRKEALLNNLFS